MIFRKIDWIGGIKIALIVGSILIGINQWEAINGDAPFSLPKALLTYAVPFFVYQYGRLRSSIK